MRTNQKILGSVALALLFCAGAVADTLVVNYGTNGEARLAATGANIGYACEQVVYDNKFAAFVVDENREYRVVASYDVRPEILGFTSAQVTSATLNWGASAWGVGRSGLNIDQVDAGLVVNGSAMYSTILASVEANRFIANGGTNSDITAILKTAMDNATDTKGISFRWYNNNTADPLVFDTETYTVLTNSGFTAGNDSYPLTLTIEYNPVPEPASMGLILIGGLATVIRRRRK